MTVSVIAGDEQATFHWNGIGGVTAYDLYRSLSSGVTGTLLATVSFPGTSYTDTPLANGTAYYYTLVGRNSGSAIFTSRQISAIPNVSTGTITITGTVQYQDKIYGSSGFTGSMPYKFVRYADVELVSASTSSILYTAATDSNGLFSFGTISAPASPVYIRVLSVATLGSSYVMVKNVAGTGIYGALSSDFTATGSASLNLLISSTGVGGAFNMLDVFTNGFEFVDYYAGSYPPSLAGHWQAGNTSGTYYCPIGGGCGNEGIYIYSTSLDTDEYDDDVLYHEFGHFTAAHFSKDDSQGGAHMLTSNDLDMRLAWSEGWGDSMPGNIKMWLSGTSPGLLSSANGLPLTEYVDTTSSGAGIAIDMGDPNGSYPSINPVYFSYATSEIAIAKILLYLNKTFGMQDVWSVIEDFKANPPATKVNLELFWDRWHSLPGTSAKNVDSIFSNRLITYSMEDAFSASTYTVGLSSPQIHTLYANGDADVVSFGTNTGQHYTITTDTILNGADTYVELYNDPLMIAPIVSNDNTSGFNNWGGQVPSYYYSGLCDPYGVCHDNGSNILGSSVAFTSASAGPYFVKIKSSPSRPVSAGRYGTYTFKITTP